MWKTFANFSPAEFFEDSASDSLLCRGSRTVGRGFLLRTAEARVKIRVELADLEFTDFAWVVLRLRDSGNAGTITGLSAFADRMRNGTQSVPTTVAES